MADAEKKGSPGSSTLDGHDHLERKDSSYNVNPDAMPRDRLNAMFENPLQGIPKEHLMSHVDEFYSKFGLMQYNDSFRKGAFVAQNPPAIQSMDELSDEDKSHWERMDESANKGAQIFYLKRFNIQTCEEGGRFDPKMVDNLTSLVVGPLYLACAILGCWLTAPLNSLLGRRGTIWISCFIAAVASIWETVANSWVSLFIARFVLGLGIGSGSTTIPVYAAECSPALIRGAIVMMWQMWTAFGTRLGKIMGVAFLNVGRDLNWRLMLGSTAVLPIIVCLQVYYCPESPRWLIKKNKVVTPSPPPNFSNTPNKYPSPPPPKPSPSIIREIGMSFATATTWCFNFILSFTWPSLVSAFKSQGAFALTLEELDQVFSVPTWKHNRYQLKKAVWAFKRYVLRRKIEPMPPFWLGAEKLEES
ncbi:MAG: hypothetical protein Q9217_000234 [Psora testacea]